MPPSVFYVHYDHLFYGKYIQYESVWVSMSKSWENHSSLLYIISVRASVLGPFLEQFLTWWRLALLTSPTPREETGDLTPDGDSISLSRYQWCKWQAIFCLSAVYPLLVRTCVSFPAVLCLSAKQVFLECKSTCFTLGRTLDSNPRFDQIWPFITVCWVRDNISLPCFLSRTEISHSFHCRFRNGWLYSFYVPGVHGSRISGYYFDH